MQSIVRGCVLLVNSLAALQLPAEASAAALGPDSGKRFQKLCTSLGVTQRYSNDQRFRNHNLGGRGVSSKGRQEHKDQKPHLSFLSNWLLGENFWGSVLQISRDFSKSSKEPVAEFTMPAKQVNCKVQTKDQKGEKENKMQKETYQRLLCYISLWSEKVSRA